MANVEVPPIELRPFEKEIIDSFKTFAPALKKGGHATPRKGAWIRGHLQSVGEDNPWHMWKRWTQFCRLADVMAAKIKAGTYDEFRTYIWLLRRPPPFGAGLILFTRSLAGRSPEPRFWRNFYSVNPAELGNPLWENPYRSYASHMRWARRKFRRPGEKRKKRGRPPARGSPTPPELGRGS